MKKPIVAAALIMASTQAVAFYNANMSGAVVSVSTYDQIDSIYFRLANQPSSHPACNATYFVIDGTVPSERRKVMYTRLLTAFSLQESVNIGYDSTGSCAEGYIRVHSVG